MADIIYCYPNSDVLINKLGIRDRDKLHSFERRLTMLRLSELLDRPIIGKFDLEHLKRIHGYIFQDIYEWAGQLRTVDIAKDNMFCNVKFIEPQAEVIFGNLRAENYLLGFDEDTFVKRLAYYFSEINALHPFREGNGRSQREFIRSLALHNGYIVSFAKTSAEDMISASKKSFLCNYEEMERLFAKCVHKR
ncbi:MAG: Fic family protein [Oscillospiraceae bacterium]|nr:Fic family protein [Oscillospiraceae bacterium]